MIGNIPKRAKFPLKILDDNRQHAGGRFNGDIRDVTDLTLWQIYGQQGGRELLMPGVVLGQLSCNLLGEFRCFGHANPSIVV